MKNKFCREILSLSFLSLLFLQVSAQQKALKIGDDIPEKVWSSSLQVVNSPQKTLMLSESKEKLILLDFWNTWCSACLKSFPKMENLQQKYGDRLKIIAVTTQDRPILEKFFASKNGQRFKDMLSVTEDQLFQKLFPHVGVPFIVWIKDGKLLTTTDSDQVNEKSIGEVLQGRVNTLQTVVQHDDEGPLMMSPDLALEKGFTLNYYTFFGKGRMRGLGFGTKFHRSGNTVYGRQFTNLSLSEMYRIIADELFLQRGDIFTEKRMITELKGENDFENPKRSDGTFDPNELFSYDFIRPIDQADSLYAAMFSNLNQVSNYTATIEKRTVPCLVLTRSSSSDKIRAKGVVMEFSLTDSKAVIRNASMHTFVNSLNGLTGIALPIIDETIYTANVDIDFGNISTLAQLRTELSRYDLQLIETKRPLDMLIIRNKVK